MFYLYLPNGTLFCAFSCKIFYGLWEKIWVIIVIKKSPKVWKKNEKIGYAPFNSYHILLHYVSMSLRKILSYDKLSLIKDRDLPGGGGTQLWVTRHVPPDQKDPPFFARFHRKTLIFTNFHPMTPFFNKLLVTERPWHIFVTQRPLIFAFIMTSLMKRWKLWCISLKGPLFCALCHSDWKTPTSEVFGGTRRSLSYVSAPGGFVCNEIYHDD